MATGTFRDRSSGVSDRHSANRRPWHHHFQPPPGPLTCVDVQRLCPPKPESTDGGREDSGRGWVRELQGRWPGVGVDGRSADGLQSPHRAPKALCGSCDARDGERIRSRGLSRPGWGEIAGTLSQLQAGRQAGNGMACSRAKARLNWVSQGQRRGRCKVRRRADGMWFSPTPYLRSRMAFSTSAWRR